MSVTIRLHGTCDTTTIVNSGSYIYKYINVYNIHEYISSHTIIQTTTNDDYSKRYERTS